MRRSTTSISSIRESKGYSLDIFAHKLCIEQSVLKGIERGVKIPSLDILIKMCNILNVSAENLLFNEQREPLSLANLSKDKEDTIRQVYKILKDCREDI